MTSLVKETRLDKVKVLLPENPNRSTKMFGGKFSGILNWNDIAQPHFYEMREELRGLFWRASEIDMDPDIKQFPSLPGNTQKAFLEIIGGVLSSMDSPQTDIALRLSQFATDSSVISTFATIADQEGEHNLAYSYVLSSLVPLSVQNESFEFGKKNPIILARNERLKEVYNEFATNPTVETALKGLVQSALLEGLYFYTAFAFFYNLARNNQMVATSTMIHYINRDELQHGRFISEVFRATLNDYPELNTEEFTNWVYEEFEHAVQKETEWAHYVMGNVRGLDIVEMEGYIKYRANKMLRLLGLSEIYPEYTENPMKWIRAYVDNFDDTKTDFFEQRNRGYTKTGKENGFSQLSSGDDLGNNIEVQEEEPEDANGFDKLLSGIENL